MAVSAACDQSLARQQCVGDTRNDSIYQGVSAAQFHSAQTERIPLKSGFPRYTTVAQADNRATTLRIEGLGTQRKEFLARPAHGGGRSASGTMCSDSRISAKKLANRAFQIATADGEFGDEGGVNWDANQMHLPSCESPGALVIQTLEDLERIAIKAREESEADGTGGQLVTRSYWIEKDVGKRLVCFIGDFRDVRMGIRNIPSTENEPLILRFQGSRFAGIGIHNDYTIVDGLLAKAAGRRTDSVIAGSHVVINNSIFEEARGKMLRLTGSDVTIQNSIIRETAPSPGGDSHCIIISGREANRAKILRNKIYDCGGDGIQIQPNAEYDAKTDIHIEGNSFFLSERYTLPSGHSCGENAIDLKGGSGTVVNNIIHNFHMNEPGCSGTGSGGAALVAHMYARDWILERNTVFSVTKCIPGPGEISGRTEQPAVMERSDGRKPDATYKIYSRDNTCENEGGKRERKRLSRSRQAGFDDPHTIVLPGELGAILAQIAIDQGLQCGPAAADGTDATEDGGTIPARRHRRHPAVGGG